MNMTKGVTPHMVTVSTLTLVKVALILLLLWALYLIADVLILLIASLLFAAALDPWVDTLQKKYHIPRAVSMLTIYAILIAVISSAIVLIAPPLIDEIGQIAQAFPHYYTQINEWLINVNQQTGSNGAPLQSLSNAVTSATTGAFSVVSSIFGGIASFILVLFITYYLVVDEGAIKRIAMIAPKQHQAYFTNLITRLQKQMGIWLRAQVTLMAIIGAVTYLILLAIGMPYALVLAMIAGLTEFIPYLGPLLGAVPAVIIASSISPLMILTVIAAYYLMQLFENNIIVPKIMEKALGLSPVVSIMVFLIGARLAGIAGALLAIPIATAAMVVINDLLSSRNRSEAKPNSR